MSTAGSPMDEMIQLYDEKQRWRHQFKAPSGVRRVLFRDLEHITFLLDYVSRPDQTATSRPTGGQTSTTVLIESSLRNEGGALSSEGGVHDPPGGLTALDHHTDSTEVRVDDTHEEVEELELDPVVDAEALAQAMRETGDQHVADAPSEEQIGAARVIQRMYRRKLVRRRGVARTGLSAGRHRHFVYCWEESEKMLWPRGHYRLSTSPYRFFFLGPLPHLLLCLERARTSASEGIMKAQRRMATANHQDLEDVQVKVTEAK